MYLKQSKEPKMPGIRHDFVLLFAVVSLCLTACDSDSHCPEGLSWCWTQCVDCVNDSANCGSCDNACELNEVCIEGECICPFGFVDCNGVCTDRDGEVVCRELVEGTKGFCSTYGKVDDTCESVADCIGYRIPVPTAPCCSDEIVTDLDCAFADRRKFPSYDECTADEECRRAPRACIDGRCVLDMPENACEVDEDCLLLEAGCACLPASSTVTDYSSDWGQSCAGITACPPEDQAFPRCIEGYCHIAGPFLDPKIDMYCQCFASVDNPDPLSFGECVEKLKEDRYYLAALFNRFIATVDLAENCLDLLSGPWWEMLKCIAVLCP
jgi:hypothetical protein